MLKRKNLYNNMLIGIAFIAIAYCMTANTLGKQYGSIYQFSKVLLFAYIMVTSFLGIGKAHRSLRVALIDILLLVMILWNSFITYENGYLNLTAFVDIALWPLVFICAKKWGSNIIFTERNRKVLLCVSFVTIAFAVPNLITRYTGVDKGGYAVGATYSAVLLLPLILTLKNDKFKKMVLVGIALVVLISTKRTAFISVILAMVGYYLCDAYVSKQRDKGKKILKMILMFLAVSVVVYFVIQRLNLNILDRLQNLTEDGGSGRDEIWSSVIAGFKESSVIQKITGHGYHSVTSLMGKALLAHNDYLEILYDYGLVGIGLVLLFVLTLIRRLFKLWRLRSKLLPSYFAAMVLFLMFSGFSYLMVQSLRILFLIAFFGAVDPLIKIQGRKQRYERAHRRQSHI